MRITSATEFHCTHSGIDRGQELKLHLSRATDVPQHIGSKGLLNRPWVRVDVCLAPARAGRGYWHVTQTFVDQLKSLPATDGGEVPEVRRPAA